MQRKIDIGDLFERLFAVYKAQFSLLFPAALIIYLPTALIIGAVALGGGLLAVLIGVLLQTVASVWFQGMVIEAVRDMQDGRRDFTLGGLFQSVLPVLPMLLLVGVLAGLGILVGLALLIVPGLILLTIWSVVGPAVVIERRGLDAFSRSLELVRADPWRVFFVIVIVYLLQTLVSRLLGIVFGGLDSFLGSAIGALISGALVAPVTAIAAALLYLDLRSIKGEAAPHADAGPTAPATPSGTVGGSPEMPGI